jgi:hypothetical protein
MKGRNANWNEVACALFRFRGLHVRLDPRAALVPRQCSRFALAIESQAHVAFQWIGRLSILLMAILGVACPLAPIGLARNAKWGRWLGIVILAANLVGDLTNAFVRHDLRTLIGVPIAGAMIFYLARFESQMTKKSSR